MDTYEVNIIDNDETGISCVSLVDAPAVESNFMLFSKQIKFSIDKNKIIGCLLRANFPIYRCDGEYEYNIIFSADIIQKITQKYQQTQKSESVDHNGIIVNGVKLTSLFIKDVDRGINPIGFEDVEDGSLFAVYEILNEDILNSVLMGTFRGFSIEGLFDLIKVNYEHFKINKPKNDLKKKIMNKLLKFFIDESKLIEHNGDFIVPKSATYEENVEVEYLYSDNKVEDGDYENDNIKISVKDGVIVSVIDKTETETETETEVDEVKEEVKIEAEEVIENVDPQIAELKRLIEGLTSEMNSVKDEVAEIKTKLKTPNEIIEDTDPLIQLRNLRIKK